jgi:RNA polymerase sigma-70 factor, ECF subfamily
LIATASTVSSDPTSDDATLQDLQRGNDAALNLLIDRWQRPLLGFAFRYVHNRTDAHDLVAETFVRLYQQRDRLRSDSNLSAWLFTTLANLCRNHHRWRLRHPSVATLPAGSAELSESDLLAEEIDPAAAVQRDEAAAAVQQAIGRLPHDLKTTLLLHHYEQRSYREIGAVVGCSERGVETRLYRARQQLRQALAGFLR